MATRAEAPDYPARFARRVRQLRGERPLEEIADRAGLGLGALSEIENGKRWGHRFEQMQKLAGALGVSIEELLDA